MTFLEYCCERLMGPPVRRSGGCSIWHCPRHQDNHPSFNTFPPKDGCKDRFKCWSCDWRGDKHDLLIELRPELSYPERCRLLDEWRMTFEHEQPRQPEPVGISHRGQGSTGPAHVCISCKMRDSDYNLALDAFDAESNAAIQTVLDYIGKDPSHGSPIEPLKLAEQVLQICMEHNLHPMAFAQRCTGEIWFRESAAEHMAECDDPDCDYRCCRLSRGWTEEELAADIKAGKKERAEAKKRKAERVRYACRNVRSSGNRRTA